MDTASSATGGTDHRGDTGDTAFGEFDSTTNIPPSSPRARYLPAHRDN